MARARATWTDERLDDFATRVDQRLNSLDENVWQQHEEIAQLRRDAFQERFDSRQRAIHWIYSVNFVLVLATFVSVIATAP
jgi:hypothetical protein